MWWEIETADANQITELRRLCCRHCWGFCFQYQWQDAVEFEEASDRAKQAKKPAPKTKAATALTLSSIRILNAHAVTVWVLAGHTFMTREIYAAQLVGYTLV